MLILFFVDSVQTGYLNWNDEFPLPLVGEHVQYNNSVFRVDAKVLDPSKGEIRLYQINKPASIIY